MTQFHLPLDFKPSWISQYYRYGETLELAQKKEIDRLNKIGLQISDYLALIKSGDMELSDFQALSLAIELYKTESLGNVSISGDVGISGSIGIDDGVFVRGDITTTQK